MKKILLFLLVFLSLHSFGQVSKSVVFDFDNPTGLTPSVTPAKDHGSYVPVTDNVFTEDKISLSFLPLMAENAYMRNATITTYVYDDGRPNSYRLGFSQYTLMQISAASDVYITKIVMTGGKIELSPDKGTYNQDSKTWTVSDNSTSSVKFSNPHSGYPSIKTVTVYYTAQSEILEPNSVEILDKDLTSVYTYSYNDGSEQPTVSSFSSLQLTFSSSMSKDQSTVTMVDQDYNSVPKTISTGSSVMISALSTIVNDGTFTITIPARSFTDGSYQNVPLVYTFKVREPRNTFNPESDPAAGTYQAPLPATIKLIFPSDVELGDLGDNAIVIKKGSTPMYSASLAVDSKDKSSVLLTNKHGAIENTAENIGTWKIVIPETAVHNAFKGNDTYDRWNEEWTLTYMLEETPDPLKDKKDSVALLKKEAAAMYAKINSAIGYPKADNATTPLSAVKDIEVPTTEEELNTAIANLKTALSAFYNCTDVVLPEASKWYNLYSVNKKNSKVALTYADGAVTLGGTATAFQVESLSDGVAVLKVKAGKDAESATIYKYLHVLLGTNEYLATSTKNVTDEKIAFVNNLTLGKMLLADTDDQKPVAGLLTINGCVGNDKSSGSSAGNAYALVVHGSTPSIATSVTETTLYFEDGKTNAFFFEETVEPQDEPDVPAVSPKADFSGNTLDSNKKALTLIISGKEDESAITSVSLSTSAAPYFVYKVGESEGSEVSTFTGTSILEKLDDGEHDNYFKMNANGLEDGDYYLILPVGTFVYTENVTDERMKVAFTIKTTGGGGGGGDTPTPHEFSQTLPLYVWPLVTYETYLKDTDLNDIVVYVYKSSSITNMVYNENIKASLVNAWNDSDVKPNVGSFVPYPEFKLPPDYGDPDLVAFKISWDPVIKEGDYGDIYDESGGIDHFKARIVIPTEAFGDQNYESWLKDPKSVSQSACQVNIVQRPEYKVNNKKATGIRTISATQSDVQVIYDLQGRRVTSASKKGIYIINGRKVVIK